MSAWGWSGLFLCEKLWPLSRFQHKFSFSACLDLSYFLGKSLANHFGLEKGKLSILGRFPLRKDSLVPVTAGLGLRWAELYLRVLGVILWAKCCFPIVRSPCLSTGNGLILCLARAPGNLSLASHAIPQLRCLALLRYLRLCPGALAVHEHKEITPLSSKILGTQGQTGLSFT